MVLACFGTVSISVQYSVFQIIVLDWLWAFPACMLWARVAVVGHVFHPIGGQHFADLTDIFELLSC